jgi:hypothetical protein
MKEGCAIPALQEPITISGSDKGVEIVLGPSTDAECGYVFFIPKQGSDYALLSPRNSTKVFGHPPYTAQCKLARRAG